MSLICLLMLSIQTPPQASAARETLDVSTKLTGKKLEISGTVDLADGSVLQLALQESPEQMQHHKVECRIEPLSIPNFGFEFVEVRNKKFSLTLESAPVKFYTASFTFSRFAQRDPRILKSLGPDFADWTETRTLVIIDGKAAIDALQREPVQIRGFIDEVRGLANRVDDFARRNGSAREWQPLEMQMEALQKKLQAFTATTVYPASATILVDCIPKMSHFAPADTKILFPPGSPEAEHATAGALDIPEGINNEWQMELIRCYLTRAARTLTREQFLPTLRNAIYRWDRQVSLLRAKRPDAKAIEANRQGWESALALLRNNAKAIESKIEESAPEKDLVREWCLKTSELADSLQSFLDRQAAAPGADPSAELQAAETVVRQAIDALNSSLRRVPAR